MIAPDVAVIGGGIMGVASAAFLAEAGVNVTLYERWEIAAAASGRNSGVIQRPPDAPFAALQEASLELYRELAHDDRTFVLDDEPAGLLIVSSDEASLETVTRRLAADHPTLQPLMIRAGETYLADNGIAADVNALRLEDGYPVAPAAVTEALAGRARRAGARLVLGRIARPQIVDGAVAGVELDGSELAACGQVVVAAGPWTPELIPGWAADPPIHRAWGVVVAATMEVPPRPVLEELGIDSPEGPSDVLFSLVTSGDGSSVGSTFLPQQPDAELLTPQILERAARFVPAIAAARRTGGRLCARPVSFDGRPFIGRVPDVDGLYVCAGHGPWGISTGAASARLLADIILGRAEAPSHFDPARPRTVATGHDRAIS